MSWDRHWFLTQKLEFWGKLLLLEMNGLKARGKREHEIALLPTGSQVVPITEPDCQMYSWRTQACPRTLYYAKLTDIEQGEKKTPGKFLDRLQGALRKFAGVDLEITEGEMILKGSFFTQSSPDICHKLQKQVFGPNQSLEQLLQCLRQYILVENMRRKMRQKRTRQKTKAPAWLLDPLWNSLRKNAQRDPGEKGWTCYYCGKEGHLKWDWPESYKPPPAPCPVCKGP